MFRYYHYLLILLLALPAPLSAKPLSYHCVESTESEAVYFYEGEFVGSQALIVPLKKKLKRLRKRRLTSEKANRRSKRTRKEIRKLRRGSLRSRTKPG